MNIKLTILNLLKRTLGWGDDNFIVKALKSASGLEAEEALIRNYVAMMDNIGQGEVVTQARIALEEWRKANNSY